MSEQIPERESMEVDVVIVGAGPAGLSAACKLMQLAQENEKELSVVVLEKGSEVGRISCQGPCLSLGPWTNCFLTGKTGARHWTPRCKRTRC